MKEVRLLINCIQIGDIKGAHGIHSGAEILLQNAFQNRNTFVKKFPECILEQFLHYRIKIHLLKILDSRMHFLLQNKFWTRKREATFCGFLIPECILPIFSQIFFSKNA